MSTRRLYLEDPYLQTFEAQVVDVASDRVVWMHRPSTREVAAALTTWAARSAGWEPCGLHRNEPGWRGNPPRSVGGAPALGARVTGEIDWLRRYALMRTHTAMAYPVPA